jgi:RNA polymerase sigma-70 factor (ECF subfamily)
MPLITKEEFANVYEEFFPKLYRYVFHRVEDHATSEDLVSQVFFKALKNLGKFDADKGNVSTWLYSIASNAIVDHYRKDEAHASIEDFEEALSYQTRHGETIDAGIRLDQVMDSLRKLPLKNQEIIALRIFEELPFAEIAKIVGIGESAAKMGFARGIEALKNSLPLFAAFAVLLLK